MPPWLIVSLQVFVGLLLIGLILRAVASAVRRRRKKPMPHWMASVIDNPLRRLINPPKKTVARLGVEPGMRVLEVGPGYGSYTLAAARRVGKTGRLIAVDIQEEIIRRLKQRIENEGLTNLEARVADVHALPFDDGAFDLVYMITVIGEIPDPVRAMKEFQRVLVPGGRLIFSENYIDPDYTSAKTLIGWAEEAGLEFLTKTGGFYNYISFERPVCP